MVDSIYAKLNSRKSPHTTSLRECEWFRVWSSLYLYSLYLQRNISVHCWYKCRVLWELTIDFIQLILTILVNPESQKTVQRHLCINSGSLKVAINLLLVAIRHAKPSNLEPVRDITYLRVRISNTIVTRSNMPTSKQYTSSHLHTAADSVFLHHWNCYGKDSPNPSSHVSVIWSQLCQAHSLCLEQESMSITMRFVCQRHHMRLESNGYNAVHSSLTRIRNLTCRTILIMSIVSCKQKRKHIRIQ